MVRVFTANHKLSPEVIKGNESNLQFNLLPFRALVFNLLIS